LLFDAAPLFVRSLIPAFLGNALHQGRLILSRQELIFHTGIFIGRATALKIFLAVAFLLCEIS